MRIMPLLILMIFAVTFPIQTGIAAVPSVGTVKYLRGSVVAIRGGHEVELKKGDAIFEGDLIKTGRRSSIFAAMKGDENNTIRMGQKSQLEVKEYRLSKGQVVGGFLRGLIGIFTVELNRLRKGSRFTMKTPTAVLGVRGTVWGSVVKADGSTTFAVKRGSISVKMGGKLVLLRKGQSVTVTKLGVVSPVRATTKALEDALDSNGETFDNSAAEATALVAAKKAAKEAAEALAEAATEAEKLADAAEAAEKEATLNPDDTKAKEVASELAEKAEKAADMVVAAAEASTNARDGLDVAKSNFVNADAGVPVVVSTIGTPRSPVSKPASASDPTAGFEPGAAGPTVPASSPTTPVVKPPPSSTGGGGVAASPA